MSSSAAWQEEEKRVYALIESSSEDAYTVAVFCGATSTGEGNGGLSFWVGQVVRCGGPCGGAATALVHRPAKGFRTGCLAVKKNQPCVRVQWWQLRKRVGGGISEYEPQGEGEAGCSCQWLLLRSILPVQIEQRRSASASTLKIDDAELERVQEVTGWVPVPEQAKKQASRAVAAQPAAKRRRGVARAESKCN